VPRRCGHWPFAGRAFVWRCRLHRANHHRRGSMRIGKLLLTAVAAVGVTCGSYAAYCGLLIWSGNHHTVAEGQLYRSAQLSGQELGEEIDAHRIRTVLNLRGPNPTDGWYQDEVAATRAHGAALYDVGISAQEPVAPEKIEKILAVLRDAPKPILVHCRSGAASAPREFVATLPRSFRPRAALPCALAHRRAAVRLRTRLIGRFLLWRPGLRAGRPGRASCARGCARPASRGRRHRTGPAIGWGYVPLRRLRNGLHERGLGKARGWSN
jgi:protein tyrosine phosphatase (PTP) superfamily phosphohydrolase (DUF442 family)